MAQSKTSDFSAERNRAAELAKNPALIFKESKKSARRVVETYFLHKSSFAKSKIPAYDCFIKSSLPCGALCQNFLLRIQKYLRIPSEVVFEATCGNEAKVFLSGGRRKKELHNFWEARTSAEKRAQSKE